MLFDKKPNTQKTQAELLRNVEIIDETIDFNEYAAEKMKNIEAEWKIIKEESRKYCAKREARLESAQATGESAKEIMSLSNELSSAEATFTQASKKYNETVSLRASLLSQLVILKNARDLNLDATEKLAGATGLSETKGEFN